MTSTRPPIGVRYRRSVRHFRLTPRPFQGVALAAAALLVLDIIAVGGVGSPSRGSTSASVRSGLGAGGGTGLAGVPGAVGVGGPDGAGTGGPGVSGLGGPGGAGFAGGTNGRTAGTALSTGSGAGSGGGAGTAPGPAGALGATDRGVTATSIRVVFPWPNLGAIGQATGISTASEDPVESIKTYVADINNHGGILGRKIDPEIVSYDPLSDSDMRSKCIQWTQDEKVFAVVDTFAWHDDQQLCITQENHTPLISGWSTVPEWTQRGAPYLWWTGPDDSLVVENLIAWAKGHGYLNSSTKFGVVAADRESDTLATQNYLVPALRRAGLTNYDLEVMHYSTTDDGAAGGGQGGVAIAKFRAAGITTVLPLLPFPSLAEFINTAQAQNFYPRYLLSDYESTLSASLGLADAADQQSLQDMSGPTSFVMGNSDDPRGYGPQAMDCYKTFKTANPGNPQPGTPYLEATGTAMTWCQNIRLFAAAARAAGPNLTRDRWAAGMATLAAFNGTVIPSLAYGPGVFAGPHLARTVAVHENQDHKCPLKFDGGTQGSCWLVLDTWQPMHRL